MEINKYINKLLVTAKRDSDRGHKTRDYGRKDELIVLAVETIKKYRPENINWRYFVGLDDKENIVVYFDTKIENGQRFQISFHVFGNYWRKALWSGRRTTWSGKRHSNENTEAKIKNFYKVLKTL